MQEQLDSNRLKQDLRNVVNDVEKILDDMSETAGEQVGELKSRAGRQLRDVSARLGEVERNASVRMRAAGQRTQEYVQQHPWAVIGGASAMAFILGMLSRTRH